MQELNTVIDSPVVLGHAHMDDALERFLAGKKPSTAASYRCNFTKYFIPFLDTHEFLGAKFYTFREAVDAIKADNALPSNQMTLLEDNFINQFLDYLDIQIVNEKPLSKLSKRRVFAAVQSAMKKWKLSISVKDYSVPQANAETESYEWNLQDISIFNALLKHPEYRALDAYQFQSGLGLGDVIVRPYIDIKEAFEAFVFRNEEIIPCYKMTRGKTGVKHHNCIGPEAMMLVKVMFDERYGENGVPEPNDLIFPFKRERPIHDVYAARARDFLGSWPYSNPMGPHSKRKAFKTFLTKKGAKDEGLPSVIVEHYMGHKLKTIEQTYVAMQTSDWRQIYMEKCLPALHFDIITTEEAVKLLKKRKAA